MSHFSDRLTEAVARKGSPVCVGIDPVLERLPEALWRPRDADEPVQVHEAVHAIRLFVEGVLEAVADHVPCVKFQSACFERYFSPGVQLYHQMISCARRMGLIVIGDAKRGDIGISASHYAAACLADCPLKGLGDLLGPDALTVNGYMGPDCIEPFLNVARQESKGLFVLVRTSNPGADVLQSQRLSQGGQLVDEVAAMVAQLGQTDLGTTGLSLLGAVVGATKVSDMTRLRTLMPRQIFLVPGFGAQGGRPEDIKACFHPQGTGALITASRSVLYAYANVPQSDWKTTVAQAARDLNHQVAQVVPRKSAGR